MPTYKEDLHLGHKVTLWETDDIADGAITTEKIADNAVTEEKLSEQLRTKMAMMVPTIALGFYSDDPEPVPMLSLNVRLGGINETVVPYLLMAQQDVSDTVIEWEWKRESGNQTLDEAWNNLEKAHQRTLNLDNDDFPPGWTLAGNKIAFRCSASFEYEGTLQTLINIITVI